MHIKEWNLLEIKNSRETRAVKFFFKTACTADTFYTFFYDAMRLLRMSFKNNMNLFTFYQPIVYRIFFLNI